MLSRGLKIQVAIFLVVGLVAAVYLAVNYGRINVTNAGYDATVTLPQSGGLFANSEVNYLGVPVGTVQDMSASTDGVVATIHINSGAPRIPADAQAHVHDRSVIGEQYLDLSGGTSDAEALSGGDVIHGSEESLPPSIDQTLRSGRAFFDSVPKKALNTVIDEAYEAARGTSRPFASLLHTSRQFVKIANDNFLTSVGLIENSQQVLRTQQASAASIQSFSHDLDLLAHTLKGHDAGLRTLIGNTPAAARQIDLLFREVGRPLGTLMSNLVSTARIFGINSAGVRDTLIRLPGAISIGFATNGSQGQDLGLATTFFDPLPCTQGYGGTQLRTGLKTSAGKPFNLGAGCTMSPSSGTNVRGPRAVLGANVLPRVRTAATLGDLMGGQQ